MKSNEDSAHILAAPPFFFIIPLLVGAVVEYFIPTSITSTIPAVIIGLLFSWASLPFIIFSLREFYKVKTAFDARRTTNVLVTKRFIKSVVILLTFRWFYFISGCHSLSTQSGYLFWSLWQFILCRNFVLK